MLEWSCTTEHLNVKSMIITHICFAPPFQEFGATWKSVNNDLETKSLANHSNEKD